LKCKYGKIIGYIQIWICLITYIFDFLTCILFIWIQADDVPRSDWNVGQLKDYCLKHGLTVVRQDGKNKAPIRKDYYDIARVHAEKNGLRYKADAIMKSYGIKCVRCGIYSSFFLSLWFSHSRSLTLIIRGIEWKDHHLREIWQCFHSFDNIFNLKKLDDLRVREWEWEEKVTTNSTP
jgi:hypothetical protein